MGLVKRGWERVLRARLEDARFFWRADLRESFEHWLQKLDAVIFIGGLGSMGDKTRRLEELCRWLAGACAPQLDAADAARAGRLSKADLVSAMVGEFDTLQGVMGGIYAARKGESATVAAALGEPARRARFALADQSGGGAALGGGQGGYPGWLLRSGHDSHRRGRPQRSAALRLGHHPHYAGIRPQAGRA